ncbi:NADH-ubiquinone/plastoquinone (complex I) protein [Medicago truncatula]|uniref:NADH-ubiquinone/plastoquinone (Complex I) protein n=1 Tax=Medicago truncatula TaxID=3880 RepID=A0A072TG63_MEDTR|nr:NADH-ubiquinone/plastoquinone (complex I) protein [Medicago truncatula]
MGFIILGIGYISDIEFNGAVLQIIYHGFIGTALFFLAGTRTRKRTITEGSGTRSLKRTVVLTAYISVWMGRRSAGLVALGVTRTSYDRLRLLYLDEMGGITIPMPKIFMIFTILSMTSLALSGMSGSVAELIVFLE